MRRILALSLGIGTAVAAGVARAQAPAPPPAPPAPQAQAAPDPALLAHLKAWEAVMAGSKSFHAQCVREYENSKFQSKQVYDGTVRCLKPSFALAYTQLRPAPGGKPPGVYEMTILNPTAAYKYACNGPWPLPPAKLTGQEQKSVLEEYRFPAGKRPNNIMLDFLSGGITAKDALERFAIRDIGNPADPNFLTLEVRPRLDTDAKDFLGMTLVLYRPNPKFQNLAYLPAKIVLATDDREHPNLETWTFTDHRINDPRVTEETFKPQPVSAPQWEHEVKMPPAPAQAAPVGPVVGRAR